MNRRAITLIVTAAVAIGVPLAAAPAAQAAARQVYVCHTTSVTANVGDTLVIHNDCGATDVYVDTPLPSPAVLSGLGNVAAIPPSGSWTATAVGLGNTSVNIGLYSGGLETITVTVVAQPVPAPVYEAHDYFQQVGVPASGKCSDVASPTGHWAGFPFGGWGKSWAQWINNGKGGPVCTREITFSPTLGAYVLVS